MYKLYINDEFIMPLNVFNEYINRTIDDETNENIVVTNLIVYADVEKLPEGFQLSSLRPLFEANSIQSIEVKNEEDVRVYFSTAYTEIHNTHWSGDLDLADPSRVVIGFSFN